MAIVDKWSKQELESIAQQCTSMSEFATLLGYRSKSCFDVIRRRCEALGVSLEHFTGVNSTMTKRNEDNVFVKNSTASQTVLRRWYTKGNYTEYKCSICGLGPFWNGKELTLTLDHINGDNHDDRLENLRWVCPNCDRQLDTFCSKNAHRETFYNYKPKEEFYCADCGKPISQGAIRCALCSSTAARKVERPDADELYRILIENNGNFTTVGRLFGISDNGIRKWCAGYNMPTHSKDYKEGKHNEEAKN